MNREQAHSLLNRAKIDKSIPVKQILDALEVTGDLSNFDRQTHRSFADASLESCYLRTRTLSSQ